MSTFENTDQLRTAVRGILSAAPDANTAKRWIQALPGPMHGPSPEGAPNNRGMYFEISGDIVVRFNEDGSRSAVFVIATQADDPNPTAINIYWTPDPVTIHPQCD